MDLSRQYQNELPKIFVDGLMAGDKSLCLEVVEGWLNQGAEIKELYEKLIRPSLYRIGELWEHNKISVATEHLASAIVESILNQMYHYVTIKEKGQKTVIVACVENEHHQIGIKMVSDIFEMNGWNSFFLGSNTPTLELLSFIEVVKPDILAISLSIYFHIPTLEFMIKKVRERFPNLSILVGGQGFLHGGRDVISKYENVVYKSNLESLDLFIKNL